MDPAGHPLLSGDGGNAAKPTGVEAKMQTLTAEQRIRVEADILGGVAFPGSTAVASGYGPYVSPKGARLHLEDFRRSAGNPEDGLERILLDQIALAHLTSGQLLAKGGEASTPESIGVYHNMGHRMMRALCESIDTLRKYRLSGGRVSAKTGTTNNKPTEEIDG